MDFKPYLPSYEAPVGFLASPIYDGSEKIGVAVFQFPIDTLNIIMGERNGMGQTGETYLVGPDHLIRSDSYLDPENHSVVGSFKNPDKGSVETEAAKAALNGQTGAKIIDDRTGNPALSAYTPISFNTLRWALLAEIDEAEAFAPVEKLRVLITAAVLIAMVLIVSIALWFTRSITGALQAGVRFAEAMSNGDLTQELDLDQKDEFGVLASDVKIEGIQGSTKNTVAEINQIVTVIENINEIVGTIATTVEELKTMVRQFTV